MTPVAADPTAARDDRLPNNLDAMRLLLAATVIVSHAYRMRFADGGDRGLDPLEAATGVPGFSIGSLAVDGFFVLSGYLIAGSYLRSASTGEYLVKRVLRIYPGFLVAFAISVTLFAWLTFGTLATGHSAREMIWRGLTLQEPGTATAFGNATINGSMWTIRPEFACYLMIALLGAIGVPRRAGAMAAVTVVAWATFLAVDRLPQLATARFASLWLLPRLATYFLLGSCAFLAGDRIRWRPIVALALLPVIAASCLHPLARTLTLPPTLAYTLLALGLQSTPIVRRASRFGDFSYGLYLYAAPVQQYLRVRRVPLPLAVDVLVVVLMTTPFAIASWFCIERVALRWKTRRFGLARSPVTAAR